MQRAPSLVAPALLLPVAAAAMLAQKLPDPLATAIDAAPLLVFASGALLGLVTRRGRLVTGVVVLALADCALVNVGSRTVFDAVALLLPLNLAVLVWLGEDNPQAGRGALLFGIMLLQAALVAALQLQHPQIATVTESLEQPLVGQSFGTWSALPRPAVLVYAAAFGLVLTRALRHGHALAVGAAWALVASFLGLDAISAGGAGGVHFATAGLLLLVGATWEPRLIAATDDVTGLPTRMEFNRALRNLPRRYAVAYVEIDDFLTFRAAHGSPAARRMLRLVARRLARVSGRGRAFYCDPTFAVVFPWTPAKRAARHLDAVRVAVEDLTMDIELGGRTPAARAARAGLVERTVSVTISAGVAESRGGAEPRQVAEAAERALERARQAGMNRVSR